MNKEALKKSVTVNLRCVTQSCKGGVPLNRLQSDYKDLIGTAIPFKELGYESLQCFLQSMPDVVCLKKSKDGQYVVEGVADASTAHIVNLISKQKTTKMAKKSISKKPSVPIRKHPWHDHWRSSSNTSGGSYKQEGKAFTNPKVPILKPMNSQSNSSTSKTVVAGSQQNLMLMQSGTKTNPLGVPSTTGKLFSSALKDVKIVIEHPVPSSNSQKPLQSSSTPRSWRSSSSRELSSSFSQPKLSQPFKAASTSSEISNVSSELSSISNITENSNFSKSQRRKRNKKVNMESLSKTPESPLTNSKRRNRKKKSKKADRLQTAVDMLFRMLKENCDLSTRKNGNQAQNSSKSKEMEWEKLRRSVQRVLSMLTPQKFQTLNTVIDLIFEKAIDEPNFIVIYANLCRYLGLIKVPLAGQTGRQVNFRKLLITKCQKEFEQYRSDELKHLERITALEEAEPNKQKEMKLNFDLEDKKMRYRQLANIRIIGELFKVGGLIEPIMHECIEKLLSQKDELSIECICILLKTVGKELDETKIDKHFCQMQKYVDEHLTSTRVLSMLQDLIDLKMNSWVPRRDENIFKTFDQIHQEAKQETCEQQIKIDLQNMSSNCPERIALDNDRMETSVLPKDSMSNIMYKSPLNCLPRIRNSIASANFSSLLMLNFLLFGNDSYMETLKRGILAFDGFPFCEGSEQWKQKELLLSMLSEDTLREYLKLLCIECGSDNKKELLHKLMQFLALPSNTLSNTVKKNETEDLIRKEKAHNTAESFIKYDIDILKNLKKLQECIHNEKFKTFTEVDAECASTAKSANSSLFSEVVQICQSPNFNANSSLVKNHKQNKANQSLPSSSRESTSAESEQFQKLQSAFTLSPTLQVFENSSEMSSKAGSDSCKCESKPSYSKEYHELVKLLKEKKKQKKKVAKIEINNNK